MGLWVWVVLEALGGELLTRSACLGQLHAHSPRWNQTEQIEQDSRAQLQQVRSYRFPQIQVVSRQYFAKFDALRYGLPDYVEASVIGAGSTGVEIVFSVVDPALWNQVDAAEKHIEYAQAQKAHLRSELEFLALAQYLAVQKASEKVKNTDEAVARARAILAIAETRLKAGLGVRLDLMRAEVLLASEELKALEAGMALKKAKVELASTLGREVAEDLEPLHRPAEDASTLPPPSEGIELEKVRKTKPDLVAAQAGVEATQALVRAAQAEYWPKLYFATEVSYLGARSFLGLGPSALNASVGLQLTIPLFTGGRLGAKEARERSQAEKVFYERQQLDFEVQQKLTFSAVQWEAGLRASVVAKKNREAAREEVRLATQRFQSGSASGLDVRNAHNSASLAADAEVEALAGLEAARINYFRLRSDMPGYLALGSSREGAK